LHPALEGCAVEATKPSVDGPVWDYLRQTDLIIAVYAQYFDLLQFLPRLVATGPRIVFDYHGVTPAEYWPDSMREEMRRSARQRGYVWFADHAMATSAANARELQKATGFAQVTTLSPPVDLDRFRPVRKERYLQRRLGIAGPILLYAGRLAGNKRVPVLIEALARWGHPSAHVAIVGDFTDIYADEASQCMALAQDLGVASRVHWLGMLDDGDLARAYQSADALVVPSLHEGFCVPVIEAMACGLPVIAARAEALPETVGDAGLTFAADDVDDLVRQLRRVVRPDHPVRPQYEDHAAPKRRVAFVCFRFGPDIVGGAETSLRTMATALHNAGHHVEIFTTCTMHESRWINQLPPGEVSLDCLTVHRYPIDAHDASAHDKSVRAILEHEGCAPAEAEEAYVRHSIHSSTLLDTLRKRRDDFDAIITGPYLFGLTADVAREFPQQTLIVPCFHDEAIARLATWPQVYGRAGGVLYHSNEEQAVAQARFGVNHPNAHVIGTWLQHGDEPARPFANKGRPYVVYCGRYSAQKNIPLLLAWAERYESENPGRLDFVFIGQGDVKFPRRDWLHDLGRVDEPTKRNVLSGALALVQLSTQESLSLVALEAWAEGTPVIVHRDCAVLAGQVERSGGGRAVADYAEFAAALDWLLDNHEVGRALGDAGRDYVSKNYLAEDKYVSTLIAAIDNLRIPIAQQMRERGARRAELFARPIWQRRFAEFIENLLTQPPRPFRDELVIEPLRSTLHAGMATRTMLLSVRLTQRGTVASATDGPGQTVLCCEIRDDADAVVVSRAEIRLPGLVTPGSTQTAALPITLPEWSGSFRVVLWRETANGEARSCVEIPLEIGGDDRGSSDGCVSTFLETVQETLPKAHQLQQLPADYLDVTEGTFAPIKRMIKQKVLNNFKQAYVDVLSRQQSQVNAHLVLMIQQLSECCATLDHAIAGLHARLDAVEAKVDQATPSESAVIDT
jgi:glycosyltransferase involved in cell wall biosynthesis